MSWDTDVISIALVVATGGLTYATLQLKAATDTLARNQILPRLSIAAYRWTPVRIWFSIQNNGSGTAYSITGSAEQPTGASFSIEEFQDRPANTPITRVDLPIGQSIAYTFNVDAAKFRELNLKFRYTDANNHHYSQELVVPK